MGARGPVPNRDDDLARDRSRKGGESQAATRGVLREVGEHSPNLDWHPIALNAWRSLETSGMADFYQDSDWAYAYFVLDELSSYLTPGIDRAATEKATKEAGEPVTIRYPERKLSGMSFTAIISAMTSLGMTEGDRRRMRVELEAPREEHDAQLIAIDGYKSALEED